MIPYTWNQSNIKEIDIFWKTRATSYMIFTEPFPLRATEQGHGGGIVLSMFIVWNVLYWHICRQVLYRYLKVIWLAATGKSQYGNSRGTAFLAQLFYWKIHSSVHIFGINPLIIVIWLTYRISAGRFFGCGVMKTAQPMLAADPADSRISLTRKAVRSILREALPTKRTCLDSMLWAELQALGNSSRVLLNGGTKHQG